MKKNYYTSIPKLFATAQLYIYNATGQADIQKAMNQNGFTLKRLTEGKALLEACKMLHSEQNEKYTQKRKLAGQLKNDEPFTRQTFEDHIEIVRFAFRKEADTLLEFGIDKIARKVEEWTLQASHFYSKAAVYSQQLAQHGLTPEEIAQASAMVEAMMTVRHQRLQRKGEAQQATRTRDQSVKTLKAWMKDFRATARLALKDQPQLLEALDIVVKTEKV